jgi:hypothetical protein
MREILHALWHFVQRIWPYTKTVSGAIAAVMTFTYMGTKAMFELIAWLHGNDDGKVQEFLDSNVRKGSYTLPNGGRTQQGIPKGIDEIVESTGLSKKRTLAALKRLRLKRLAAHHGSDQWSADVYHVTAT